MTDNQRARFTVITNTELENNSQKEKTKYYHTNPFYEKLVKFANEERKRFSVEDLLR